MPKIDRAITIAMALHQNLMEVRRLNTNLQKALDEIKILKGVLPICCYCGEIRDNTEVEPGKGPWIRMDEYINKRTSADEKSVLGGS
ncbi:hypothetical protein UWK_00868 [Desulfocapsa sulfexigens DSM 10523]|uniref:Uncharacterized protein n=1 Tax=Desulfocapsa sulfexigens (strain DSM 10523 / SB164P1) TaxID=1167006 RepID=M1P6X2_DESSD|nr:hypothetical protein [Desulfocapsa sulfexigens]AGF77442.1 hypothetical protein UWK_00868 [Desulfocapsa sulfexigens DSM 10523]